MSPHNVISTQIIVVNHLHGYLHSISTHIPGQVISDLAEFARMRNIELLIGTGLLKVFGTSIIIVHLSNKRFKFSNEIFNPIFNR